MKILVPIDFSPGSSLIVDHAIALAKSLNASVTLLTIFEAANPMSGIVPGSDDGNDNLTARGNAERRLQGMIAAAAAPDVRVETDVQEGSPVDTIVRRASAEKYDLIVMGTHGRSGIAHMLMGSVAEAVLRRAPCPVMTLHLPAR
ncbi:MAG: universal stress protein [Polyangiaceae bacterium]